jgi:hypothetical protein
LACVPKKSNPNLVAQALLEVHGKLGAKYFSQQKTNINPQQQKTGRVARDKRVSRG